MKKKDTLVKVAAIMAALFVILLGFLHFLEPELKPSWRLISEYELGSYGWLMRIAFFALALSGTCLLFALWKRITKASGRTGLILLAIASIGLVLAGIFTTDAVNVPRESWTTHGAIHAWGALMVIPTAPFLTTLLTFSLIKNGVIQRMKGWLWVASATIWASFLLFMVSGGTRTDGTQSASDWYGWPNRAFIVAFAVWLLLVAWSMMHTHKTRSK